MPRAPKKAAAPVIIQPIKMHVIYANIVGVGPGMIMHRFDQKAWRELLLPALEKNKAGLQETLKHDPIAEFRGALYRCRDQTAPTMFHVPNGMVAGAMASAATDIPGAKKAEIERLVSIAMPTVHIYGVPTFAMDMVRNSDMNHTPDVRTRPYFDRWAIPNLAIKFKVNPLTESQVFNLLSAAGEIIGLGDWRRQKGGDHGSFRLCNANDKELKEIVASGGRKAQQRAWDEPVANNEDTEELFAWFKEELERREKDVPSAVPAAANGGKRNGRRKLQVIEAAVA